MTTLQKFDDHCNEYIQEVYVEYCNRQELKAWCAWNALDNDDLFKLEMTQHFTECLNEELQLELNKREPLEVIVRGSEEYDAIYNEWAEDQNMNCNNWDNLDKQEEMEEYNSDCYKFTN